MFQNISDEIKQEEIEDVNEKESKGNVILRNILKLQNVIVYIITFCISTVKMGLDITPFGIVMFAVACGSTVPAGIVLAVGRIRNINFIWNKVFYRIYYYSSIVFVAYNYI